MEREQIIQNFLNSSGYGNYERKKLPADASFRKYERLLDKAGSSLILMDAAPPQEDVKPFLKVGNYLQRMNLSSPKIYSMDVLNGLLVLEDFGSDKFANIFNEKPSLQPKLYRAAVDVLAAIRLRGEDFDLPDYSTEFLLREADLFIDWYLPLHANFNSEQLSELKIKFHNLIIDALMSLNNDKKVLVLRDYHSENLMLLRNHEGEKRVGLLDFQDALIGHPVYDLVSLLDDARRDVSSKIQAEIINYYLDLFPKTDREQFLNDYAVIGAQRNLKILGIFSRLKVRDGKAHYLPLIPRVRSYLLENLQADILKPLREFLLTECGL
jgi:aminoglycoside/choline kinase family phosphotransferase